MKSIILARVSTEEQREAGNSLPAQIARMKKYCAEKDFEIIKEYSFDESAYKTKRDEFDAILEDVKKSKEVLAICFDKVDRLSRNIFDKRVAELYEMAIDGRIELHFVSDHQVIHGNLSATEKSGFSMNLVMASYYSNAISDNVKRAFEKMRADGKWTGKARIGYKNVTDENGNRDIVIDEERDGLVRRMFEMYATGNHSITSIWKEVTELGLKNTNSNPLQRSNVDLILKDTFYYGMAYSKKYNLYFPHKHGNIISKDLFQKCQEVRLGRKHNPAKVDSNKFIFKGLLRCKNCGCTVTPERTVKKSGKVYVHYSCTNSKGICKRQYVQEKHLLEPIYGVLERLEGISEGTLDYVISELRKSHDSQTEFHKKQLKRINSEYNATQNKIKKLTMKMLEDNDSITQETYEELLQDLKTQQHKLTSEIEVHTRADKDYLVTVSKVFSLAKRAKSIFESSETNEKRVFLNYLIQNPCLDGKKLEFSIASPFNLIVDLDSCPSLLRRQDSNLRPID